MSPTETPRVLALLLSWNDAEGTLRALAALARQSYPALETLVIDNASADGTVERVRNAFPEVGILEMGRNTGFTGGTNAGIREAARRGFPYVFAHNQDVECHEETLERLVDSLAADPRAAAANPTIHYKSQPGVINSAGGGIDWRRGATWLEGRGQPDDGRFGTTPRQTDFVPLCATLLRMEAIERCGNLDEGFFAYYEDCEWCVRAQRAGFRILHVPTAKALHDVDDEARDRSAMVHYLMTRNRLLFLKRSGASRLVRTRVLVHEYARTLASWTLRPRWRFRRTQRNAMLRAIFDYLLDRSGAWDAPRRVTSTESPTSAKPAAP